MPLPAATGAIWEAHSGRVPGINSGEEGGGERGGVADARKGTLGSRKRERRKKGRSERSWKFSLVPFMTFCLIVRILM